MQSIPTDRTPTVEDITTAFSGALHSSSGEPYYWELAYKLHPKEHPIPIDEEGQAQLFKLKVHRTAVQAETTNTLARGKFWECNSYLCNINQDSIDGIIALLIATVSIDASKCHTFYLNVDKCPQSANSEKLGHSMHCLTVSGCQSLLRPARTISCHYPSIRSFVRRLYEARRLCQHIESVK